MAEEMAKEQVIEMAQEHTFEMAPEVTQFDIRKNRREIGRRMPYKRPANHDEIAALAEQLRVHWRAGDAIRPWLRKHGELLLNLVHNEFSWDAVAAALNCAEITYRTGNPWTGRRLNREYHRAKVKPKFTNTIPNQETRSSSQDGAAAGRTFTQAVTLVDARPIFRPVRLKESHCVPERQLAPRPAFLQQTETCTDSDDEIVRRVLGITETKI